jgi:hypothetical protein
MSSEGSRILKAIVDKTSRRGLALLAAVLTIAPIGRLVYILATTGANTPSSDDEQFIPFFLGHIMSGHYNWLRFPRDTFQNTHVTMVPALAYVAMAYLDHLNVYHLLYLGILLAVIKLVLLHSAFTIPVKGDRVVRLLSWPVLSWLIFSVSQMSVFEHGFQSLKTGFNELGLALGVWAMIRFRKRWMAVVLMAAGGIVASFSFACGLILWPLFLAGMAATGVRKKAQYVALFAAAVVAVAPYADLLYFHRVEARQTAIVSLFDPILLINYLGRPFTNGSALYYGRMAVSEAAGVAGVLLLLGGILFIWRDRQDGSIERATSSLILVLFSILTGWQITLYRTQIAPWYIPFAMDFWIGLAGMACVIWARDLGPASEGDMSGWRNRMGKLEACPTRRRSRRYGTAARAFSAAMVAIIVAFYVSSNRTRSDKSFFLRTRAPVSAACLRNYLTAPTYCEQTLVPWEAGFSGYIAHLAEPLAEHRLSVFAPHQCWSLQGDFMLDTVRLHEASGSPEVYWARDLYGNRSDFTDYNHLNLVLGPPNYVTWSISLPADLESAAFHSAVSMTAGAPSNAPGGGVTLTLDIEHAEAPQRQAMSWSLDHWDGTWHPFAVPLSEYAGKTVTLKLAATGQSDAVFGAFKYPWIELSNKDGADQLVSRDGARPSNTDLSPACAVPGPQDYRLDLTDRSRWKTEGLVPASTGDNSKNAWLVTEANPVLEYTGPIDVDLGGYSHFFITMAAAREIDHRAVRIYYKTDQAQEFNEGMVLVIPLLADGEMHTYTYDLKITGIRRSHLAGIKIVPIRPPLLAPANRMEIADFGLIRRTGQNTTPETPVADAFDPR